MFIKKLMEEKRIAEIREKVTALLEEERLKEAIAVLAEGIDELQDWSLRTRFTQMQTAYDYLLEYLRNGTPDPGRESMHRNLMGECYMLNDIIALTRESEKSLSHYSCARRHHNNFAAIDDYIDELRGDAADAAIARLLPNDDDKSPLTKIALRHESTLDELFATLWCSTAWSKGDAEKFEALIADEEIPVHDRELCVSAATLSLLKSFEPTKAIALIRAAERKETGISIRALIGVIVATLQYSKRVAYYPALQEAINAMCETPRILSRAETVQIQLLRCRETKEIDRKMREEIIPAMMKNPHINSEKMGIDIMREIENEEGDDKNPEWKEWVEKDEIKDKLEEMAKWQTEGADVYMSTFSQLKKYPFFNSVKNWLRPFDKNTPAIADILPGNKAIRNTLLGAICASRVFCNSDKYSFCLTFKQIPQEQRNMLMQQIAGGDDIAADAPDTHATAPQENEAEHTGNQYIQDLYRFFKLSPFGKEVPDIFSLPLNLFECSSLAALVNNEHAAHRTFAHLMDKGYYCEAVVVGKVFEANGTPDEQFYQEMGYCLQKEKNYATAIDYYTRADIIKPDSLWTLKHIAQCYRLTGENEKAASYYLLAEEIAPDNNSLLLQTGECLATVGRYSEAFARFFKVEYNNPQSLRAARAIAWCSFLTAKDEQAQNYYKKIMDTGRASFNDYLNAAHVEWTMHNNAQAVELYHKAKEMCGDEELFATNFTKDCATLKERGVRENEILLLRDLIL